MTPMIHNTINSSIIVNPNDLILCNDFSEPNPMEDNFFILLKLDFYYEINQNYSMKYFTTSLAFLIAFCFTSCVEEDGGANSGKNKPRDSKFLIPTEAQASCQLEQHKSTDKMLVASKKSNKAKKTREDRSQSVEKPYGGESNQYPKQSQYPDKDYTR